MKARCRCGHIFNVTPSKEGRVVRCSDCNLKLRLPTSAKEPSASRGSSQPKSDLDDFGDSSMDWDDDSVGGMDFDWGGGEIKDETAPEAPSPEPSAEESEPAAEYSWGEEGFQLEAPPEKPESETPAAFAAAAREEGPAAQDGEDAPAEGPDPDHLAAVNDVYGDIGAFSLDGQDGAGEEEEIIDLAADEILAVDQDLGDAQGSTAPAPAPAAPAAPVAAAADAIQACPNCGAVVPASEPKCPECGKSLGAASGKKAKKAKKAEKAKKAPTPVEDEDDGDEEGGLTVFHLVGMCAKQRSLIGEIGAGGIKGWGLRAQIIGMFLILSFVPALSKSLVMGEANVIGLIGGALGSVLSLVLGGFLVWIAASMTREGVGLLSVWTGLALVYFLAALMFLAVLLSFGVVSFVLPQGAIFAIRASLPWLYLLGLLVVYLPFIMGVFELGFWLSCGIVAVLGYADMFVRLHLMLMALPMFFGA